MVSLVAMVGSAVGHIYITKMFMVIILCCAQINLLTLWVLRPIVNMILMDMIVLEYLQRYTFYTHEKIPTNYITMLIMRYTGEGKYRWSVYI
jgi:hypothetical protein